MVQGLCQKTRSLFKGTLTYNFFLKFSWLPTKLYKHKYYKNEEIEHSLKEKSLEGLGKGLAKARVKY